MNTTSTDHAPYEQSRPRRDPGWYFDHHCICDCPNNTDQHVIADHPKTLTPVVEPGWNKLRRRARRRTWWTYPENREAVYGAIILLLTFAGTIWLLGCGKAPEQHIVMIPAGLCFQLEAGHHYDYEHLPTHLVLCNHTPVIAPGSYLSYVPGSTQVECSESADGWTWHWWARSDGKCYAADNPKYGLGAKP